MDPDSNPDADPDPAFRQCSSRRQQRNFSPSFFAFYVLKVHLHHFSEIKSHKEVTQQLESMFLTVFA
jgi:hypothetical protein